tara:strand:+ start:742 stop:1047 length:306 start_codon:yes stop_codon:yes gene_type:complete
MSTTVYKRDSNYASTSMNRKYLNLYEPPLTIDTLSEETTTYIIQPKFNKRPDLMAFELYGSARLWWVFAHYNRDALLDPIMDFTSGTKIIAPNSFQVTGTL